MPPDLYKATVRVRWRNANGTWIEAAGGDVVEFDEGDFGGGRALTSLEDVLARGLFVPFDPAHAGDPDYMSRDEMLEVLNNAGKAEGLSPAATAEELRPLVQAHLSGQTEEAS